MNILKEYRLIPLEEENGVIRLAVPRSYSYEDVEEIRFRTGKDVELVVMPDEEFARELQERLSKEDIHIEGEEEETKEGLDLFLARDDSPAVSLVNQVLIKASTDGVLHDILKIPTSTYQNVVSRIKVMSNLNVAERRVPQDGRIRVKIGNKDLDVRVSVVPTVFGERVVLRLLDKTGSLLTLERRLRGSQRSPRVRVNRPPCTPCFSMSRTLRRT